MRRESIGALIAIAALAGCAKVPSDAYPGYAEAENVRLTAPLAGTLTKLHMRRGDTVPANAPAFVLEQASEIAATAEARSRIERAQAQLADLRKGKRPDELAAVRLRGLLERATAAGRVRHQARVRARSMPSRLAGAGRHLGWRCGLPLGNGSEQASAPGCGHEEAGTRPAPALLQRLEST